MIVDAERHNALLKEDAFVNAWRTSDGPKGPGGEEYIGHYRGEAVFLRLEPREAQQAQA